MGAVSGCDSTGHLLQAKDRLKTEEELAKEEKEKLERLEVERLRRMKSTAHEEEELYCSGDADNKY